MIWILIMAFVLCGSIVILQKYLPRSEYAAIALFPAIISGIVLIIMIIFTIEENVGDERHLVGLQAEREALVYQVENNIYFGDSVGRFNSRIMTARHYHDSPWTNAFYGDYWYEIEPIELK